MKMFKSRKVKKKRKIKLYIFIFFFIFSYVFMIKFLENRKLKENILNNDVNYIDFNISDFVNKNITSIINNPVKLLNTNIRNAKKEEITNKSSKKKVLNLAFKNNDDKPLIYIYNTHDKEGYDNYNVCDAAILLKNKLIDAGYNSIYEERSVKVFLDSNNLKYYKSYEASRNYINTAINENPSLKYFFDIHRDSVSKDKSTIKVKNKSYAKTLLVVGSDNSSYSLNLKNANYLNDIIESKVPGISRGVMIHGGKGYNGVYNQDLSENVFLIEVGAKENTKEEVENTINVITDAITEYIKGVIWLVIKNYFIYLYGFYFLAF